MITLDEFKSLAKRSNVIPLHRITLADLHTPVSSYLALREAGRPSFLFESVEPDESIGRFSFVGIDPIMTMRARDGGVELNEGGTTSLLKGNIFDALSTQAARFRQASIPGVEGFLGGFVGYIGYPAVAHLERVALPEQASDQECESVFGLFTSILRFDHRRQTVTLVHNVILNDSESPEQAYERGRARLEAMELKFLRPPPSQQSFSCDLSAVGDTTDHETFCSAVRRAKEYIVDGDIFQVVLSRRVRVPYAGDLFAVYRALRIINPSPYLFHLEFGQTQLSGSSPEVLVRVMDSHVEVLPIAGTRRRGATSEEDERLEQDLLSDEKERAEHVMLVDLGRNDVGRISRMGSVEVPVFMRVERYSHVMHMVSEVHGALRDGLGALDAFKACFPAGTVSGAPKVRAMEIIAELEGSSRGAYAGAVGYLGLDGSLDTCIAIRTIVAHRGVLSVQAGAGIVADSNPETEYQETLSKSRALLEAIRTAASGLRTIESIV